MVAALDRLARAFQDDRRARRERFAQHSETADLGFGSSPADDARHSGAMPVEIAALPGHHGQLATLLHDGDVIGEFETTEPWMTRLDPAIEHRDPHPAAT